MLTWCGIWAKHWRVCQYPPCLSSSFSLGGFPKHAKDQHLPHLFLVFPTWNPHGSFSCCSMHSCQIILNCQDCYIYSNGSNLKGCLSCQLDSMVLQIGCGPFIPTPCPGDTRTNTAKWAVMLGSDPGVPVQGFQRKWLVNPSFCK